ncbi:MAG: AraC-like DNA-binding protein [Lentisphaeria bacterium]|jgi:AraC-like DNA-binding protein
MPKILFNIDDLALIMVISSSLLLVMILLHDIRKNQHNLWLSGFLITVGIGAIDSILYWSPIVKLELEILQPHAFFFLKIAPLLGAPILYIYTKSQIIEDFKLRKTYCAHLAPAAAYILTLPFIYGSLGKEGLLQGVNNYEIYYSDPIYWTFTWALHFIKLTYACFTVHLLHLHKERLKYVSSNTAGIDGKWLKLLVLGFITLWLIRAFAQIFHQIDLRSIAQHLALFGNYVLFTLVNILVIFSLSRPTSRAQNEVKPPETNPHHDYTDEQISRLKKTINQREPFLNPDLTLEELSKICSIPKRTLSLIINRYHNKNFFEFVNEYRVTKAVDLLLSQDADFSMLDIMTDSGFNSKTVFNRVFKKLKGMTPTQYRDLNTR